MACRTLIGGTGYDIKQGRTLVGGTGYDIKQGRTLVGGTGYDIFTQTKELTFEALMAAAALARSVVGRNASSTSTVSINYTSSATSGTSWTEYVFAFCNGYCSFNKIVWNGTTLSRTALGGNYTTSYGQVRVNGKYIYYSANGSSSTSVYGATLVPLTFSGYTEAEIAAILGGVTATRGAGRNASGTGTLAAAAPSYPCCALVCCNTEFACDKLAAWGNCVNIFTNYSSYPTLLRQVNSTAKTWGYAHSSSASMNCYGGSLIFVT